MGFDDVSLFLVVFCTAVALFAGLIKGITGFAMPMILVSGLSTVTSPELAIAGMILPTVATNVWQALRGGLAATIEAMRAFWVYLGIVVVFIAIGAQVVLLMSDRVLFLVVGLPVTAFSLMQLVGWKPRLDSSARRRIEVPVAVFAGFIGGISGTWGPPTVLYLTALETPKALQVRIQGVVYGVGAVVLLVAHLRSGLFNGETATFSALLLVPALLGLLFGFKIQDRIDQTAFKRITLIVLTVAGLNLIRRGLMG